MKKILLSTVLLIVMLFSVACSGGNNVSNLKKFTIPEEGFDMNKQIEITFSTTMGKNLMPVLEKHIGLFNKLYPKITVKVDNPGGYDDVRDEINKQLTVGDHPSIAYCYPDHVATYNIAGAVVTLDDLIASQIEITRADGTTEILGLTDKQKGDFIKSYYEEGRQFGDNLMYTLPMSKSTEVLYYNKTFFNDNNLPVPDHWWCTDKCAADCKTSMEKVCEAIKKIAPTSTPLGYDSDSNWFITMCEQMNSGYTQVAKEPKNRFLFDNETNRAFVKKFHEWYKEKGYITTQSLYGSYTSALFVGTDAKDPTKRSYMTIGSSAGASHQVPAKQTDGTYPFQVGIAPIPQYDKNNAKVISQGPSLCLFNKKDPQEVLAAWLFMKYLTTTLSFQAEFSFTSGYVPVLSTVAEDPTYKNDFLDKANGDSFLAATSANMCLEQKDNYFTSPAFDGSSTARDQVGLLIKNCLAEDVSGTALDNFIKTKFKEAIDDCIYQSSK